MKGGKTDETALGQGPTVNSGRGIWSRCTVRFMLLPVEDGVAEALPYSMLLRDLLDSLRDETVDG